MDDEKYNLVFRGQLARGADLGQSKKNLAHLFKITPEKVEALFSGRAVTLKKNLDFATATKYRATIKKAGCLVELEEAESHSEQVPSATGSAAGKPSPDAAPTQVTEAPEPKATTPEEPASAASTEPLKPREGADAAAPDFGLAPTGADLLRETERERAEPVEVDISAISVKSAGGDLLNPEEKEDLRPVDVDTSALDLAETGADLLHDSERESPEPVKVDTSQLSMGEVGETLEEIHEDVEPVNPDISHLKLEP